MIWHLMLKPFWNLFHGMWQRRQAEKRWWAEFHAEQAQAQLERDLDQLMEHRRGR